MIKPLPRLILIAAVIGGGVWGINKYVDFSSLGKTTVQSAVPGAIDLPVTLASASTGATASAGSAAAMLLAPASGTIQTRMLVLPWNAETSIHFANGDVVTAPDSLMARHGVKLQLERQDDYAQMVAEQVVFASEVAKGVANPSKGAAFVVIMGDGAPGYFASAQDAMGKLGQQLQIIGSLGYSRGEDKCMLPV